MGHKKGRKGKAKHGASPTALMQGSNNRELKVEMLFKDLPLATSTHYHNSDEKLFEMYKQALPLIPKPTSSTNKDLDYIGVNYMFWKSCMHNHVVSYTKLFPSLDVIHGWFRGLI